MSFVKPWPLLALLVAAGAHAQESGAPPCRAEGTADVQAGPAGGAPAEPCAAPEALEGSGGGETVVLAGAAGSASAEGRATSRVRRSDLERRLPRSAPDALRYEPGVFVQQTAHGQGSAFIRGLTGQQTVLLFDGIRLNNSTWRQGPNQYFFTLDALTVDSLEVLRGGASTRYGSDALGGVVQARPLEPRVGEGGLSVHPRLLLRGASADVTLGGRVQAEATLGPRVSFLGGVGARRVGLLESGGPVLNPADGQLPLVPRFAPDGRTQLGTGFRELTADARLVLRPTESDALTLAAYLYRQYDAPRTDQCPPAYARYDECLLYEEQFRTLVYGAWEGRAGGASPVRATLSWQQQHERRRNDRPASFVTSTGRDVVNTLGATVVLGTEPWVLGESSTLALRAGADSYLDVVDSKAWLAFSDVGVVLARSRGQYLSGSTSLYGGAFLEAELALAPEWTARAGSRLSWLTAHAPADAESGTRAVDRAWLPLVGHAGVEWQARPWLSLLANVDHSFRAPNLDDLTSRQQTGPGFQLENPFLQPERATTFELGARVRTLPVELEAWAFQTLLRGAVGKRPVEASACPPDMAQCQASWSRFQLVNARGLAEVRGLEASGRLRLPAALQARATLAWTWGEGESLVEPPSLPGLPYEARVPLSRIPPLNGTAELHWQPPVGLGLGASVRWAGPQTRLAIADRSDVRIPLGGTPGFVVLDARASWRLGESLVAALVLENLLDAAYRSHGSSINGPGRGVLLSLDVMPF